MTMVHRSEPSDVVVRVDNERAHQQHDRPRSIWTIRRFGTISSRSASIPRPENSKGPSVRWDLIGFGLLNLWFAGRPPHVRSSGPTCRASVAGLAQQVGNRLCLALGHEREPARKTVRAAFASRHDPSPRVVVVDDHIEPGRFFRFTVPPPSRSGHSLHASTHVLKVKRERYCGAEIVRPLGRPHRAAQRIWLHGGGFRPRGVMRYAGHHHRRRDRERGRDHEHEAGHRDPQ